MFLLDNSARCAHHFVLEAYYSNSSEIRIKEQGTPDETSLQQQFVRNWRERCVQKKDFWMRCNFEDENLSPIGAAILHCTTSNEVSNITTYQSHAAFLSLCPFEESFKGELFTYTENSHQSFLIRVIASMIHKNPALLSNFQEQTNAIKQLEKFVSTSRMLSSIFCSKCIKAVISRKRLARYICFNVLGYESIFARKENL